MVIVDTELANIDDIMDNLSFQVTSDDRDAVEVEDFEIVEYHVEDAK